MRTWACIYCNEIFTRADLTELIEMGERFKQIDRDYIICPDCLDELNHKDLEEQFDELLEMGDEYDALG